MAFSQDYLGFILEQLEDFGEIIHKKMFGGVGFYKEGTMFGGIMKGTLHLKVSDETRPEFEAAGMTAFMASYYEVPIDIIEDRTQLAAWAEKAYQVALTTKKVKKKKRK